MSTCIFVQLRCTPGRTYEVATAIWQREIVSELHSTSGEWDLLAKIYVPEDQDIGHFVSEHLGLLPDVRRTLTTIAFRAF